MLILYPSRYKREGTRTNKINHKQKRNPARVKLYSIVRKSYVINHKQKKKPCKGDTLQHSP